MKGRSGIWLAVLAAIAAPLQVGAVDLCDTVAEKLRSGKDNFLLDEIALQEKAQRIDLEKPLPAPFAGQKARILAETEKSAPEDFEMWGAIFGENPEMINQTWVFLDALPNSNLRRIRTQNEGTAHCERYIFFYLDAKGAAHPVPVKSHGYIDSKGVEQPGPPEARGGDSVCGGPGMMINLTGQAGYMTVDTDYRNYNEAYDVRTWRNNRFSPICTMSVTYELDYDVKVTERDIYAGFLLRQGEKLARQYTADFVGVTPRGQDKIFRDYANGNAATLARIKAFYQSAATLPKSDNAYFYPVHYDGKVYLVAVAQGWYSGYQPSMGLAMYGWRNGRAQKLGSAEIEMRQVRVATLDIKRGKASGKTANN